MNRGKKVFQGGGVVARIVFVSDFHNESAMLHMRRSSSEQPSPSLRGPAASASARGRTRSTSTSNLASASFCSGTALMAWRTCCGRRTRFRGSLRDKKKVGAKGLMKDLFEGLIVVPLEAVGDFDALALLLFQHDPQRLARLVRPELVDQVVHVDEEQRQVVDLFGAPARLGVADEDVDQVEERRHDRVVQLLQLAPVVVVVRVQPPDALAAHRHKSLQLRFLFHLLSLHLQD